jgi:hypothetical protein
MLAFSCRFPSAAWAASRIKPRKPVPGEEAGDNSAECGDEEVVVLVALVASDAAASAAVAAAASTIAAGTFSGRFERRREAGAEDGRASRPPEPCRLELRRPTMEVISRLASPAAPPAAPPPRAGFALIRP